MKQWLLLPSFLIAIQASSTAQTVLPGTDIEVRAYTPIYVSTWDRGRTYPGYIAGDVYTRDGDLAIPRGSRAEFIVRQTRPDQLALDIDSVTVNGFRFTIYSTGPQLYMPRDGYHNGSEAIASILNSIVGEPGTETHVDVRDGVLRVPSQTVIRFQLQQPLHIDTWNDRESYYPQYPYR